MKLYACTKYMYVRILTVFPYFQVGKNNELFCGCVWYCPYWSHTQAALVSYCSRKRSRQITKTEKSSWTIYIPGNSSILLDCL